MTEAYSAHEIGHPFEYDSGALGASEVEINVEYCEICHSVLSLLNNE